MSKGRFRHFNSRRSNVEVVRASGAETDDEEDEEEEEEKPPMDLEPLTLP